jgi:peptide/nickel transport system permease protein
MKYLLRRVGFLVITLWGALTVNFFIPRLMPGSPALSIIGASRGHVNPAALKALEAAFGGGQQNLFVAYLDYLGNSLRGQFGVSLSNSFEPVTTVIMKGLPWTLGLVGVTTILGFLIGTGVGAIAAWRRGGKLDSVLPPMFIVISAFPYFWIGLLVIWLFSLTLGWFPTISNYSENLIPNWTSWGFIRDVLWHAVLPAFTILISSVGGWILTMRNNMITVVAEDYVKMARAKGLHPRRILWQYAGRNAVLPSLTGFAMSLGFVISGAILVEFVFNYPGVGFMLLSAVQNNDYPLMQALFLLITVAVLVSIFIADVATTILDPRTRGSR